MWPDKKLFKSKRTETFESDMFEEILDKYLEIMDKIGHEHEVTQEQN
jgi:hypothetical protein